MSFRTTVLFALFGFIVLPTLFVSVVADGVSESKIAHYPNSQTIGLLSAAGSTMETGAVGGGEIEIDDNALLATSGPNGTAVDQIYKPSSDQISLYVVREGDTIGQIAELFGVSTNTIRWANEIEAKDTIHPGQVLSILPISSIRHVVARGDTLASITKKYDGDLRETALFNGVETDTTLSVGEVVLVPGGVLESETHKKSPTNSSKPSSSKKQKQTSGDNYYVRAWGGVVTQGFHGGYRAVDYGMPIGSAVGAAASGKVIVSKIGWNGAYGNLVVIQHDNGSQTLYAHLSEPKVAVGQTVKQGQVIGLSGNTGRSTGPHLHFEIRNGIDVPSSMR